jgi:hypothetical protein
MNRETANAMIANLLLARRFHDAMRVWNDIAQNERYRVEFGKIFDGGFEEAINYGPDMPFGWQVKEAPQLQIGIDPNDSNSGNRSLRLVFQVRANLEALNVSQLIPVTPGSEYDFEYFFRTEKLESGSAPMVQLYDATDGALLTSSAQASGTNPWTRLNFSFKTTGKTEAVILRIVRNKCSDEETPICPIFGSIWYDDFSFKRRR